MKKISWLIAILAVFSLLLVGCGGNGGGKDDNPVDDEVIGNVLITGLPTGVTYTWENMPGDDGTPSSINVEWSEDNEKWLFNWDTDFENPQYARIRFTFSEPVNFNGASVTVSPINDAGVGLKYSGIVLAYEKNDDVTVSWAVPWDGDPNPYDFWADGETSEQGYKTWDESDFTENWSTKGTGGNPLTTERDMTKVTAVQINVVADAALVAPAGNGFCGINPVKLNIVADSSKVVLAEGSLGTAGNTKITGLTASELYAISKDNGETWYKVNADGTVSTQTTSILLEDAIGYPTLTGTEITGLDNGYQYKVAKITIVAAGTLVSSSEAVVLSKAVNEGWKRGSTTYNFAEWDSTKAKEIVVSVTGNGAAKDSEAEAAQGWADGLKFCFVDKNGVTSAEYKLGWFEGEGKVLTYTLNTVDEESGSVIDNGTQSDWSTGAEVITQKDFAADAVTGITFTNYCYMNDASWNCDDNYSYEVTLTNVSVVKTE